MTPTEHENRLRLAESLLDEAMAFARAAAVLPRGHATRTLLVHGAKLLRLVSEKVARGEYRGDVGFAWLDAGRLQRRALTNSRVIDASAEGAGATGSTKKPGASGGTDAPGYAWNDRARARRP